MSLKIVHIAVILFSIAVTLFFGVWAIRDYGSSGNSGNLVWGIASLAGGIILIPYLAWFLSKSKKAGLK